MHVPQPPQAQRRAVISPAPSQVRPAQVRPGWLLGALGLLLLAALLCAYLSLCLLFVQGQWQLLYRPGQHAGYAGTPPDVGLAHTEVRFGATQSGVKTLSGWWLPATPGAALAGTTVLYLHDATGSLADTLPELVRLHAFGCAVFAIDYRGFGSSAPGKLSEASMTQDARAAIAYLVSDRHLGKASLVLWGRGIGATLSADVSEPGVPLVLEGANLPALVLLGRDPRTRLLPLRLLLRDRLDAGPALRESRVPKLLLETVPGGVGQSRGPDEAGVGVDPSTAVSNEVGGATGTARLYRLASGPKAITLDKDDAAIEAFLKATRPSSE